jgi:hypothetical protein
MPTAAWKRFEFRVVDSHTVDVIAARDANAALGAFKLRFQRKEILVRFHVRITLDGDKQASEGPSERVCASWYSLNLAGSVNVEAQP